MGVASFKVTILASTTETAPVSQSIFIGPGYLEGITLQFPAGCQYNAHIAVYLTRRSNDKQRILPQDFGSPTVDNIALDDFVKDFPVGINLEETAKLTVEGWNDDTANSHTIMVLPNLVSQAPASAEAPVEENPIFAPNPDELAGMEVF